MRKAITCLWCAALAIAGYFVTSTPSDTTPSGAVYAATIPNWNYNGQLPKDFILDQAKKIEQDRVTPDTVRVTNIEYVSVPEPKSAPDTLYMPLYVPLPMDGVPVNNKNPGATEKSKVILTVDGNVVYETDGLKKP